MTNSRTAVAPASVSNLGPGFDILGCAVDGAADRVTLTLTGGSGIVVAEPGHPDIPVDPNRHAAAIAVREFFQRAGISGAGVELRVTKGIPLSGGQGGSAASAVAGAVAANALFDSPLSAASLLEVCLAAETAVAGRHADNVAAALLGGLILVRSMDPLDVISLPVPTELRLVVVHPDQRVNTREARGVVPRTFSRDDLVFQAANAAALVAAFALSDYDLIRRSVHDRVAEPYREPLLPGFAAARAAALDAGALGASISGSGPTAFAFARGDEMGERVMRAMAAAYEQAGVRCDARLARVVPGAQLTD